MFYGTNKGLRPDLLNRFTSFHVEISIDHRNAASNRYRLLITFLTCVSALKQDVDINY